LVAGVIHQAAENGYKDVAEYLRQHGGMNERGEHPTRNAQHPKKVVQKG